MRTLAELKNIKPEPQNAAEASYAPILKKEDGHIHWSMPAREILTRVRGFLPWPGCYCFLRGQRLHVWKARASERRVPEGRLQPQDRRLYAGCADGSIEFLEVQLEGKKRMETAAFLNGYPMQDGEEVA